MLQARKSEKYWLTSGNSYKKLYVLVGKGIHCISKGIH